MKHQIRLLAVVALSGIFASRMAAAQQVTQSQPQSGSWLQDSKVTLGLGAGVASRYAGSNEYRMVPVPVLSIVTPTGFFVDSLQGAGYRRDIGDLFFASAGIGYGGGRKDSNDGLLPGSAKLKGMGEIKGSVLANLDLGIKLGHVATFTIGASQPLSNRERGLSYRAELSGTVLTLAKDQVSVSGSAEFGSAKYNQTFFGVTAEQSRNSGYAAYKADLGLNALTSSIVWTHSFNQSWSVSTMLSATHYMQKAADSPLVLDKTNYGGFTTVNYSF
ncbi:mltA-interacting MipA family protein [Collimonas arenae]|uniref:MltA-interacting MipA family protein n=1 Tax=Collimonas arenae TaxID=279058 RepID=A0A127PUG5_9BURK|nr:MipA/OmpV family protein [Collimonas arenae]AMP01460.1 mltA-interacting MipA family protein [Collimonas arenae]AMP11361.1 mltA-interacting MipA family protein [Collimonas arenae]